MKRFRVLIALLAPLLLLSAASRLRADDEKEIRKEKKKIVVHVPDQEVVVDDDGVFITGDGDPEIFADLKDFEADVPMFVRGRGGYIGVRPIAMTPELRQHFGAPKDAGVLVGRVEDDGPAAKAGLKVGDIVTSADGSRIDSARDLVRAVRAKRDGETLKLDVMRDRAAKSLTVTVAERKGSEVHLGELGPRMRGRRWKDKDYDFHFRTPMPPTPPGMDWEERLDALENRLKELEGKVK